MSLNFDKAHEECVGIVKEFAVDHCTIYSQNCLRQRGTVLLHWPVICVMFILR